jgi:hypothetical protein
MPSLLLSRCICGLFVFYLLLHPASSNALNAGTQTAIIQLLLLFMIGNFLKFGGRFGSLTVRKIGSPRK